MSTPSTTLDDEQQARVDRIRVWQSVAIYGCPDVDLYYCADCDLWTMALHREPALCACGNAPDLRVTVTAGERA